MFKRFIPGHVRAYSVWACIVLMVVAFAVTKSITPIFGVLLLMVGMFLGDQATHLHQENHQGVQPTWIENQMQKHRLASIFSGILLSIGGLLLFL